MRTDCCRVCLLMMSLALLGSGTLLAATGASQLLADDRLRVRAWIEPDTGILVGQQLRLTIEIATDRWFSGGTRIAPIEIDNAVVLRREKFATNLSRRESSVSWTVQQHTMTVYPRRAGNYRVPPVRLQVKVAGEDGDSITGTVYTGEVVFQAMTPPGLENDSNPLVSNVFEVEEHYDRELDALNPGDAIQRTVTFSAENLPAMMLPTFPLQEMPGLSMYRKTPALVDSVDRGRYGARRTEVVTYMIESPGEFRLPARSYRWWNLDTGTLETVELPAQTLQVAGTSLITDAPVSTARRQSARYRVLIGGLLSVLVGVLMLWLVLRRPGNGSADATTAPGRGPGTPRQHYRDCRTAIKGGDYRAAIAALYRWQESQSGAAAPLCQGLCAGQESLLGGLMALAYGPAPAQADTIDPAALLRALAALRKQLGARRPRQPALELVINPS